MGRRREGEGVGRRREAVWYGLQGARANLRGATGAKAMGAGSEGGEGERCGADRGAYLALTGALMGMWC